MTRVLCPNDTCVFWDDGVCGADEVTLEPEQLSCVTMEEIDELVLHGEDLDDWDDDEVEADDDEDWEDETLFGDDDDWQPY